VRARTATARPARAALALGVCLVAGGCASGAAHRGGGTGDPRGGGWTRVDQVPVLRQTSSDGCGAAALAMVLGYWERDVAQEEIRAASTAGLGEGIRADALRDFARGQGLQAFLIEGDAADLERELGRSRPVLVGVVKRQGRRAYPHYEVVVGIDRERRRVVTIDPARGQRERKLDRFVEEWAAAGRLTLVVFPPRAAAAATDREAR
jgi:ABC-type bacteriocin/lantibiotic exporter with double-glycine peptidase domain